MGIREVVRTAARKLLESGRSTSPRHRLLAELCFRMPAARDAGMLSEWDNGFRALTTDEDALSDEGSLLFAILEFAETNMYVAFDPARAQQGYRQLRDRFQEAAIDMPSEVTLSSW